MHNAIECVEYLFRNPLFAEHMDLVPRRLWETAERLNRVYGEWSTGDHMWNLQVRSFSYLQSNCLLPIHRVLTMYQMVLPLLA